MAEDAALRGALRRALPARLGQLGVPLELIAEDVLGEADGAIDWIAAAADGRAWILLVSAGCGDAAFLQEGLVQRGWVQTRIPDWRKLAPSLGLRPELPPRVLLVASDFDRATCLAAREIGEAIALARWSGEPDELELHAVELPARPGRGAPAAPVRRLSSAFRTRLHDADLAG